MLLFLSSSTKSNLHLKLACNGQIFFYFVRRLFVMLENIFIFCFGHSNFFSLFGFPVFLSSVFIANLKNLHFSFNFILFSFFCKQRKSLSKQIIINTRCNWKIKLTFLFLLLRATDKTLKLLGFLVTARRNDHFIF